MSTDEEVPGWKIALEAANTPEAKARHREATKDARRSIEDAQASEERIERGARDDPDLVIEELFAEASKTALRYFRRINRARSGQNIDKATIEVSREVRQLADALYKILQARGAATEAKQFFAELETRLEQGAINLGERAAPYLEDPPRSGDLLADPR